MVPEMSSVLIKPSKLCGELKAPPSKSELHRIIICSYLSGKTFDIPEHCSDDIHATYNAVCALSENKQVIDCYDSASTLRFMIPVAAALCKEVAFTGSEQLRSRPIDEYLRLLPLHGVECERGKDKILRISGKLLSGDYELSGNVSSQYITGLLLALPLLDGDSRIIITTKLQSESYVDITLKIMSNYGVFADKTDYGYYVKGNQKYKPCEQIPEGDWSQAAFFLAGAAICGEVTVSGLNIASEQGDREILSVLKRFGAVVYSDEGKVACKADKLYGISVDVTDIPDLFPVIAVVAAFAKGDTVISGTERLRFKESDRLYAVCENLKRLGVELTVADGVLTITGGDVRAERLDGFNDHRIVMAMSIAAMYAKGETEITHAMSINKSYPDFFSDYNRLGGRADVIRDR